MYPVSFPAPIVRTTHEVPVNERASGPWNCDWRRCVLDRDGHPAAEVEWRAVQIEIDYAATTDRRADLCSRILRETVWFATISHAKLHVEPLGNRRSDSLCTSIGSI